jgi:WD40 repeat protein
MLASCSGDRTVRIWRRDAASPTERWLCSAILEDTHSRTIRSACWSPCGRHLATASFDRTTAIWQHSGGVWENVAMLEGHESEVKEVAWNPNGSLIATCSRDKTVWLWEAQPGNEYEVVDVKHGHSQVGGAVCGVQGRAGQCASQQAGRRWGLAPARPVPVPTGRLLPSDTCSLLSAPPAP